MHIEKYYWKIIFFNFSKADKELKCKTSKYESILEYDDL